MFSHDYGWLCGGIKQALKEDHSGTGNSGGGRRGAELRSWKQIQQENQIAEQRKEREKKAQQEKDAARSLAGLPPFDDFDSAAASTAPLAPPDDVGDSVDPVGTIFPPDKARPFTAVHLVSLKPQQDWSAIKKRAAKIADLRKTQLNNAYQSDAPPGQSTTQAKAFARRQLKLDRKRMKVIDREKRDADRIALQKVSTMVLSPPITSSEESTSSEDEDPYLRGGVLDGYRGLGRGIKQATFHPRHHGDSDSEEDGPPPDEEEIRMRMQRAAWRRTREALSKTVQTMSGTRSPLGVGGSRSFPFSPPSMAGRRLQARPSIMISNDRRVQGLYAAAGAEIQQKNSIEKKEALALEEAGRKKALERTKRMDRIKREKEQREAHRKFLDQVEPRKRRSMELMVVAPSGTGRLLDRSASAGSDVGSGSLSRSQSALSIRARSRSPHKHTSDESTRTMARSDSEPAIQLFGHIIRTQSPKRAQTQQQPQPQATVDVVREAEESPKASPNLAMNPALLQSPSSLVVRRRGRSGGVIGGLGVSPMSLLPAVPLSLSLSPAAAAANPHTLQSTVTEEDDEDNEDEDGSGGRRTNNTQPTPATPSNVFSVPEYPSPAASHATTLASPHQPFTGMILSQRRERTSLPPVTNVLSPIEPPSLASSLRRESVRDSMHRDSLAGEVHSLKGFNDPPPTILQPISSIVRSFTGNPLDQVSTALVTRSASSEPTDKVLKALQANLAASDEEVAHLITPEQAAKRQVAEMALMNDDPFAFLRATASSTPDTPRLAYCRSRSEKSELASKIMMSFSHGDMENISAEIVRNGGEMTCADFIRTTRRKKKGDVDYVAETEALAEMFSEIDVNGDKSLSFLEFTSYLVELAHTQDSRGGGGGSISGAAMGEDRAAITTYQTLDDQPLVSNEDDIDYTMIKWLEPLDSFIMFEKDQVRFKVLNKSLRLTKIVRGHTMPILAIEYLPFHQLLVTSSLDKTMKFWSCNWDKDKDSSQQQQRADQEILSRMGGSSKETLRMQVPGVARHASHSGSTGGKGLSAFRRGMGVGADLSSAASPGLRAIGGSSNTLGAFTKSIKQRNAPIVPTYAEIASWNTPLPQYGLTWNKTRLYSSDATGRIIVWNVDSGDTRASLMGHELKVNCMIPVPDMLASAADDATVRLWDNAHGTQTACLRKHQRAIRSLCFSPATNLLASAGDDEYLRLWDINTHKHASSFFFESSWFKTLPGHDADSVVWMESLDHELVVGSRRGTFRTFDLRMMTPLQTFHIPDVDDEAIAAAVGEAADDASKPRRKKLLSAFAGMSDGDDDEEAETEMQRMRRRGKIQMRSFCIFRDEDLLEAHAAKVKELQRDRDEERQRVIDHAIAQGLPIDNIPATIVELPKDPRCQLIIAASGRHIHRFGKGGSITRNISHDDPIIYSEFNPNSLTIFTASSKQVKIWCCLTGRLVREYNDLLQNENLGVGIVLITSACLDQRKRKFIIGDNIGNVYIFNYNTGALMHKLSNTAPPRRPGATTANRALGTSGTDILNLHCIINASYSPGVATPSISINFVHSIANSIYIHVDDPNHRLPSDSGLEQTAGGQPKDIVATITPPRTVLHSLASHKQDITCIGISDKFSMILSGSGDGSIVCYPWELAGSPTQRIIPAEALHAIATTAAGTIGTPPSDTMVDAFKTPILALIFLHPYKMIACTDSLGHILFYYFNRDSHVLIGIIRNSRRLERLHGAASTSADQSPSVDSDSELARRASQQAKMRSAQRGRHESATSQDLTNEAAKRAMMDYPPVLSLVFDPKTDTLYTADDMGYLKGWKLFDVLFQPHQVEYISRKWNTFHSRAPSDQHPPKIHGVGVTHIHAAFKNDEHDLLTPSDIARVFHAREIAMTIGTSSSVAVRDNLAAATFMFRLRPSLVIAAHSGACTGLHLVEADASLQSRLDELAAEQALEAAAVAATNAAVAAAAAAANGNSSVPRPAMGDGVGSAASSRARRASLVNPMNPSARASLTGSIKSSLEPDPMSDGGSETGHSTRAVTPRHIVRQANNTQSRLTSAAATRIPSAIGAAASAGAAHADERNESKQSTAVPANGPGSSVPLTKKEQDSRAEAQLRLWDDQAWDADSDVDDDAPLPALQQLSLSQLASGSTSTLSSAKPTYRDARDLPNHSLKGQGRRVSVAAELSSASRSRKGSRPISVNKAAEAIQPAKPIDSNAQSVSPATSSGPCLLSFGSDGCVHIFSIATHKRLGTLQQGYTISNCKLTPNDWRFMYPIAKRQTRDEALLEEMIDEVETSEKRIIADAHEAAVKQQALVDATRKAMKESADYYGGSDPFRTHAKLKATPTKNYHPPPGLLMPPSSSVVDPMHGVVAVAPSDGADLFMTSVTAESKDDGSGHHHHLPPPTPLSPEQLRQAEIISQKRLAHQFNRLEKNVARALKKEKSKAADPSARLLRSAEPGEVHVHATPVLAPDQRHELQAQKTLLASKSMSALTPSIYNSASVSSPLLAGSASAVSLAGVRAAPTATSPAKRFRAIDYSATWTDYDGTLRTIDDPLAYRFDVDDYLRDVATRHVTASVDPSSPVAPASVSAASSPFIIGHSDDSVYDRSDALNLSAASDTSLRSDAPSPHRSTRSKRPSISIRSPGDRDPATLDHDMAILQRRAIDRQRKLQLDDAKADKKAKARSLEILQATLDREKELKLRLQSENRKLSPRSAESVRMRMLISRKPTKLLESQLESVGMRLNEPHKPRQELNAFGELTEVKYQRSGTSSFKRASMEGKNFADALKAAQQQALQK